MTKQMLRGFVSSYYKLIIILLAVLAGVIVLSATHYYGLGISTDSVVYIAASRNIISRSEISLYDGSPLITHPPLYPLLLATFSYISGASTILTAKILNVILFSIIVLLGAFFIKKQLCSSFYIILSGSLALVFSRPLFVVSTWAWSELLFIVMTVLVFIFFYKYLDRRSIKHLILFTLSAVLAFYTRYAGLILIFWGALIIFLLKNENFKKRIIHFSIFGLLSFTLTGLWFFPIANELFSNRTPSSATLTENVKLYFEVIFEWLIPGFKENNFIFIQIVLYLVFITVLIWYLWPELKWEIYRILPILIFVLLYSSVLIFASSVNEFDPINDRLLTPIYIPLVFIFVIIFKATYKRLVRSFNGSIVNIFLSLVFILWLVFKIQFVVENVKVLRSGGHGYTDKVWKGSETISYLLKNKISEDTQLYSNSPDIVYILANRSAKKIPRRNSALSTSVQLSDLRGNWPKEENVKLIWFNRIVKDYLLSPKELNEIANLDTLISLKDGSIYSITRGNKKSQ